MIEKYAWKSVAKQWQPVGSRITVSPPPKDTDEDFLVADMDKSVAEWLSKNGWNYEGSMQSDDKFASFRKDDVNVICAFTPQEFTTFRLATDICRKLNISSKANRIAVFEAIMYRNNVTETMDQQ